MVGMPLALAPKLPAREMTARESSVGKRRCNSLSIRSALTLVSESRFSYCGRRGQHRMDWRAHGRPQVTVRWFGRGGLHQACHPHRSKHNRKVLKSGALFIGNPSIDTSRRPTIRIAAKDRPDPLDRAGTTCRPTSHPGLPSIRGRHRIGAYTPTKSANAVVQHKAANTITDG